MELFTADQLEQLGAPLHTGVADDRRADMRGGRPFVAIDPLGASEIDDAIRVQRRPDGGYTVQTAIADAARLAGAEDILSVAVDKRWNTYSASGRSKRQILPRYIVEKLELSEGEQRALVISRDYTPDLQAHDEVRATPAMVKVVNTSYHAFSMACLRAEMQRKPNSSLVGFNHAYRRHHELEDVSPTALLEREEPISRYGGRLVETYMVLANVAVARWAQQTGVHILYRNFDEDKTVWDELNEEEVIGGLYAAEPEVHHGIRHIIPEAEVGYTHTTSPLRRAVDLINHLQIGAHLTGSVPAFDSEQLQILAQHLNVFGRRPEVKTPTAVD